PGIFKKTLALPPRYGTRFVQGPIEQLARRAPIARGKHPSNAHESSHAHRRRQSLSLVAHPHDRLAVHSRSVTPIHASHGKCYYRAMSARAFILSALLLIPLYAQQTPREFEVISVKPRPVGPYEGVMHFFDGKLVPAAQGNKLTEPATTLQWLVMKAFGLHDYEIIGLPDWAMPYIGADLFQVEAIAPGTDTHTTADFQMMLQSLLVKRFGLKTHRESKQIPVYA